MFLEWAREVLETHTFSNERQRAAWALYAEGKSLEEICAEFPPVPGRGRLAREKPARSVVERYIREVKTANPPPIANPWITGSERRSRLTEQLQGEAMKPERKTVEYQRIELMRDLTIPGLAGSGKSVLVPMKNHRGIVVPLLGQPHAGGIDVLDLPTHDTKTRTKTLTTVTVPWVAIKAAIHVPVEDEAA